MRFVIVMILIVVLIGMLGISFKVQKVEGSGTIYIRADGSIEGTTDISTTDNITYVFMADIYDEIVVERSNIIIDGNGCMLQTLEDGLWGFNLPCNFNVTIQNANIRNFSYGVYLSGSNCTIYGNSISGNKSTTYASCGIDLAGSNNTILGNNISDNYYGIKLEYLSSYNSISENIITSNNEGIDISLSNGNTVTENKISNNGDGIFLQQSCWNAIVENNITEGNEYGLRLCRSSCWNNVSANSISNNYYGVYLEYSYNNKFRDNNLVNNSYNFGALGFELETFIQDMDISNAVNGNPIYYLINQHDLLITPYAYPKIGYLGLINCNNITVEGLEFTSNKDGILFAYTNNSQIIGNNVTNNRFGLTLYHSSNNAFRWNNLVNNTYNFHIGDGLSFINDIDTSNTVNGKSIYYLINQQEAEIPSDAGYVILVNSTNIRIKGLELKGIWLVNTTNSIVMSNNITNSGAGISLDNSSNNVINENRIINNFDYGILLSSSNNNRISFNNITNTGSASYDIGYGLSLADSHGNMIKRNNIANNWFGIELTQSSNNNIAANQISKNMAGIVLIGQSACGNTLFRNNITLNTLYAIVFFVSSSNSISNNNFLDNTNQVYSTGAVNFWDNGYPSGGNYWSDYNGTDSDYDGIGDTPYFIDANNQDNYPLMGMFSSFNTSYGYAVDFVSNSSISDVSFNLSPIEVYPPEAILAFNVSGVTDTGGFVRVRIPKILINGSYIIRFDNEKITNTTWPQFRELPCSNETYEYLYINYTHSEHTITISGTTIIPEFPSCLILPLFMIATLVAVIVYRRKHSM